MRGRRLVAVVLAVVLLVGVGAYAWASWRVFDAVSAVSAHCGTDASGNARFGGYNPASFGTAGISDEITAGGFDTAPFAMPEYEEVHFTSRDGVNLVAWWIPGERADAAAVVLAHGMGSCRRDPAVLLPAGMLHRNGFAVLVVDLRDQGDSEVIDGRFSGGTQEYADVLGAWDWLRARGLPAGRIGILGESNGASTAVIAAGEEPEIAATWEDSGYSDTTTAISEEVRHRGFPDILTTGGKLWGRLFGIDLDEHRPIDAIPKIGTRPLMIVHGLADTRVQPHHALDFALAREQVLGGQAYLPPWYVPHARHVQAAFAAPAEYERRLVSFFTAALGDPRTP